MLITLITSKLAFALFSSDVPPALPPMEGPARPAAKLTPRETERAVEAFERIRARSAGGRAPGNIPAPPDIPAGLSAPPPLSAVDRDRLDTSFAPFALTDSSRMRSLEGSSVPKEAASISAGTEMPVIAEPSKDTLVAIPAAIPQSSMNVTGLEIAPESVVGVALGAQNESEREVSLFERVHRKYIARIR
jgi:hypothetical protein